MGPWQQHLPADPTDWLLAAEPWTRYRTLLDLLDADPEEPAVRTARAELVAHPAVRELLGATTEWFPTPATRHDDATLSHYALAMLAEFGLRLGDDGVAAVVEQATARLDGGQFPIRAEVPVPGGPRQPDSDRDADVWSALPCDAPLLLYTLRLLGHRDETTEAAVAELANRWADEVGWFCHLFFVEGQHRKLGAGCPMAGLLALDVFSQVEELRESAAAHSAFAPLRFHRDHGTSVYYFGRSDRFWTLKYPFVWYNALFVADVVSRFRFARDEPLTAELVDWLERTADEEGRFRPTSMYRAYGSWEFADKKRPSPWITFLVCRILRRLA